MIYLYSLIFKKVDNGIYVKFISDIVNIKNGNAAFTFTQGFENGLARDVAALNSLKTAIDSGMAKTEAMSQTMAGASLSARNYADNTLITARSIDEYIVRQKQSQVAFAAQGNTLRNCNSIIKSYNGNLNAIGLTQEQFRDAVSQSNPVLGRYLSHVNSGQASMKGYIGELIKTKAASLGLHAATLLLNTALSFGISLAIQGVIQLIRYWTQSQERANEAVKNAAQELSELKSGLKSLDDYKDKISELRDELNRGNLSLSDANKKREELLAIQDELIDKYGKEEEAVKNIRDAILGETDAFDKLSKQQMDKWLTNNKDAIAIAKKYANESMSVNAAAYYEDDPEISMQIRDAAISLGLADAVYEGGDKWEIGFSGTRGEIIDKISKFREWLRQYCKENNISTDIRDYFLSGLDEQENYITDKNADDGNFTKYMSVYRQAIEYETAINHSELYESLNRSKKQYENAILGDDTQLAKTAYESFQKTIKDFEEKIKNGSDALTDAEKAYILKLKDDFENELSPIVKIDIEGTKREFDSSYEELAEIYAKVGDEGFNFSEDSFDILEHYNEVLKEAKELGVDLNKTVFGNIDTNNRQLLKWTEENLNKYKDAYESLGWTAEELKGSISTVMGMADEFDGVSIAFTPMLQTDHGAVLLDENTVYEYIWALIDQMPEEWTNEDLLKLDARGIEMDGQKIKGLIADIGETAIKTSESMHFAGKDGAIADAYKYWQEYVKENNLSNISVDQASEFNAIRDAAKEAGVSIESYVDALVRYGKVRKATSSTTEELSITKYAESIKTAQDAISPLLDAYNKLQKGEMSSVDIVSLISDKFPSLIKYTDNLSLGVQKLASAKLDEIKKSLEGIDKDKLSENDLKAYEKFIEYIDNINDKFHSNLAYLEKIQTNSKNVMEVITTLISLKNEINKYGSLSESSIDKVMSNESLILLRPYLNDVKSMMPIINNLISEQKQAYEDLYNEQQRLIDTDTYMEASQQKQKEDENAFQNNLKRINDQVEKFKEKYGVDLSNWDKISDGKKEILKNTNAELLSKQLKLINDFSNYYNIDLKNFKNATEAKAAILKQFRDSEALAQASQIAVEKGWLHNYQGDVLLDGAEAIKEIGNLLQPLGLTVDDFTQYLTNGNFSYATDKRLTEQINEILNAYTITPATWDEMLRDSGGSGSGSAASKRKTWFEQQYDDHNHLVKMEKETEKDYLDWLNNAYKQAYSQGIIDLDAYYKYEEEVYNGRKKLTGEGTYWFEKEYKEHQHRLKMETEDEETYLKWLDQAYKRAYSEGRMTLDDYRKYEEEVYTGLKKLFEKQYQLHQHYLKMETEDEADYLKWLNEAYKQAYRQGLLSLEDYRKYQEEVYEGVKKLKDNAESAIKSLVDIRINMLKEDVSKEKESIDKRLKNLKDFYDKQKEMLQDKHDQEKYLEDQAEKRKKVSDIQAKIVQLRFDDSANAQKKRVELQKELVDAQKELNSFESDYAFDQTKGQLDKLYEQQEKAAEERKEVLDKTVSSPQELYEQALNDIRNGSQNLYGQMIEWNNLYGDGIRDTIKKAWEEAYKAEKQYFNYTGTHFNGVNLSNATGYVKGVSGYASGTSHAIAGIHKIDEQGVETIFQSADGQRYRMFSSGEKVLNASASDFLYKFANKGREILDKLFNGTSHSYNNVVPGVVANNIQLGDIVIQGNADKSTVSEIRRAQRENLEQMLKQLNRLK